MANEQKYWSNSAKRGLDKFSSLKSSKSMRTYRKKANAKGIKLGNSEKFYEYVDRTRLRKKK